MDCWSHKKCPKNTALCYRSHGEQRDWGHFLFSTVNVPKMTSSAGNPESHIYIGTSSIYIKKKKKIYIYNRRTIFISTAGPI